MMLGPLQPVCDKQGYTCGDVLIDPAAVIAPGVLLQAEPGCKVVVAPGACLAMGVVLHAMDGVLEVGVSASLGAGVLVIGAGKIGDYACVGAAATLVNVSLEPRQIVPPGVLLGQRGRAVSADGMLQDQGSAAGGGTAGSGEVYGRAYVEKLLVKLMPQRGG